MKNGFIITKLMNRRNYKRKSGFLLQVIFIALSMFNYAKFIDANTWFTLLIRNINYILRR